MNRIRLGVYAPLNMHRFAGDTVRITELVSALKTRGVFVLTYLPSGGQEVIASKLLPSKRFRIPETKNSVLRYSLLSLATQCAPRYWELEKAVDIVQVEWSYAFPLSRLRKVALKRNIVFDMHSIAALDLMHYFPSIIQKPLTNLIHEAQDYLCKNSTCLVVSKSMKRYILNRLEVDSKQIHVIPNGVNLRVAKESIRVYHSEFMYLRLDTELLLVYVGGLEWYEGVDLIIEALVDIRKLVPSVRLVIAGRGSEEKKLRDLVDALKLKNNVCFLGWLKYEETFALQSIADILVSPRKPLIGHGIDISTPMKIPSYLTAGVPIVASDIGEIPAVARNGKESSLVSNLTSEGFSEAVLDLYSSPETMRSLAHSCLKRAEEYSWDRIAQLIIPIYYDIVNS